MRKFIITAMVPYIREIVQTLIPRGECIHC